MPAFETTPEIVELTGENGDQNEYERVEAIYLAGEEGPTYLVGQDDVYSSDRYLCVQLATDGDRRERETHKIPHDRIRIRKSVQVRAEGRTSDPTEIVDAGDDAEIIE